MTKKEAATILAILKAAYPNSYKNMTHEEAMGTISVWAIQFAGMPADIVLIGDAMVGLLLSEGEHTVTFRYHNSAFTLGSIVSFVCLAGFVTLYFCIYKPKPRKGKYERTEG